MSYSNVNNFIVILDDDRDPDVSWRNHLESGSAGGVDCVAKRGTPIYAPDDCVVTRQPDNGSGGNTVTMLFADGWRDQFMHFDSYDGPLGAGVVGKAKKRQLVGYSGETGSPGAPHVHWHRIDTRGIRRNPWHYFTSSTAGDITPIAVDSTSLTETDEDMLLLALVPIGTDTKGPFHYFLLNVSTQTKTSLSEEAFEWHETAGVRRLHGPQPASVVASYRTISG